ncbi:MAG: hypothetical protein IPK82_39390 [Polyangiaceae bacterium]|nr:hypothetical protein [Polyangiaceae bacterium]
MTIPTALVSVEIKQIRNIPASLLTGTSRPFARAIIGRRHFGRSRVLPTAGATFDLTAEPQPWKHTVAVNGGAVTLMLEIWDDQGDPANRRLAWIQGNIPAPYVGGTVVFGSNPEIECEVITRPVPPAAVAAVVPRSPDGAPAQATIAITDTLVVEYTGIRGLYKPGYTPTGVTSPKRSEPCPGYVSEDEKGRIFLNRNLSGDYARDTQLIELAVKVHVRRGQLPASAKVKWTMLDVDDPFDSDPSVHRQWAPYIDSNDYNGTGVPTGARGGDNEGTPARNPPWEQVSGFPLSGAAATTCQTDIVQNSGVFESKVTYHCPDVAGDTVVIRAEIESPTPVVVFEAETGLMTLWHRVDVEYIRMTSALALPVDQVPQFFEQACAELNFAPERVVPDQQYMAPDDNSLSPSSAAYVNANFTHASNPGWFCLISAMEPHPLPATPGGNAYTGSLRLHKSAQYQYINVPGRHPTADYVDISWGTNSVGFSLYSPQEYQSGGNWYTRFWLSEHDVQPDFTAGDGSINHAYAVSLNFLPQGRVSGTTLVAPGYGAPNTVQAEVSLPGAFYTSGISPSVTVGGVDYFAGRTIVFSHHGAYYRNGAARPNFADRVVRTIAHELVHAFGMPHKCGYYDYKNPREHTCHMNYSPNWMLDASRQLIPGSSDHIGNNMCGRHLKEVRRVHLEDNLGLRSLGW